MPYLWAKAVESHAQGLPLLRAMILEFPGDPGCAYLDRQYMLGDSLLAAPVFSAEGEAEYYLPPGRWTNILNGAPLDSGDRGGWRRERHDYFGLPLLARPNSVIPLGNNSQRPDYDYADGICFHVFELADGQSLTAPVYNTSGDLECSFTISRRGQTYTARNTGARNGGAVKPWSLLLRSVHAADAVIEGAAVKDTPEGLFVQN
jgi:alpha-D-xyloside xylohydrolase